MKKYLALAMAFVLVAAVFAGCGNSSAGTATTACHMGSVQQAANSHGKARRVQIQFVPGLHTPYLLRISWVYCISGKDICQREKHHRFQQSLFAFFV